MGYHLDIISIEKKIFSDVVTKIKITGMKGELSVYAKHTPLLSLISPGIIHIAKYHSYEELVYYLSGGILKVQPKYVIILANTAIRSQDLDEERVLKSKYRAEEKIKRSLNRKDHAQASEALGKAITKLRIIQLIKKRKKFFNK